jgi:hydroxyacylglutathione hydrolase
MLERRTLFPHVIEMNYQARRRLGCCVYLVFDGDEWLLIDIGYEDTAREIVELIRQLDFPLAKCKYLVVTHADADHVQGLKLAQELLPEAVSVGHPLAKVALAEGDRILTYAEIPAQGISINLPKIRLNKTINEGDILQVGSLRIETWHTPGHTQSQLAFRLGDLLFSGDNIFRDGCVGNIDAHHGSDISAFIKSLVRIRDSDVKWLLPSHGPAF